MNDKKVILINENQLFTQVVNTTPVSNEVILAELKIKLNAGLVKFTFLKKDGSIREAFGTLHPDWYVSGEMPVNTEVMSKRAENPNVQTYFDVEANEWRMFTIKNLIAVY